MSVPEKAHPEYTAYVEGMYDNKHVLEDADLKLYEAATSIAKQGMPMRATLLEKDEVTRRKAQGFQTWVKGQRKA